MKIGILVLLTAIVTFSLQSLIFKKCSRPILHFFPLICIGCIYLVSLGLFISELYQSGGVKTSTLYSFILTGVNTVALVADGCAWLIEKV